MDGTQGTGIGRDAAAVYVLARIDGEEVIFGAAAERDEDGRWFVCRAPGGPALPAGVDAPDGPLAGLLDRLKG